LADVAQTDEPLVTGQALFLGAVMSEQAVRTTEAMMALAMKRRRTTIGESPDEGENALGN
jgi:hypothetical protein